MSYSDIATSRNKKIGLNVIYLFNNPFTLSHRCDLIPFLKASIGKLSSVENIDRTIQLQI